MAQVDKTERWMQLLTALGMMRGIAGTPESQIHTQEQIDPKVRSVLPRQQAVNVFLSFCGVIVGMLFMGGGIVWLLELEWDPRAYLLAWIVMALVAAGIVATVRHWFNNQVRVVQSFATVLAFLFVVLALGAFLSSARENYNPWRLGGMVVGAGLMYANLLFMYNQSLDLINPYWRQSPLEREMTRQIFPAIKGLLTAAEEEETIPVMDPRITYRRVRNGTKAVPQQEEEWDEPEPEEDEEEVEIDPEAGNLIWFAFYAAGCRSLSIADLTIHPAPVLPFLEDGKEARLRRAMIQRLIARGSTDDVVRVGDHTERGLGENGWFKRMGQGATPVWARPVEEVLRDAASMWEESMHDAPIPDYWKSNEEYTALRAA